MNKYNNTSTDIKISDYDSQEDEIYSKNNFKKSFE